MNNFSTNFVKLREERGLSIKQVASFTGATIKDVKKWESGTILPTDTKIIAALEGLLGKEISQTLESNDFKPIKTSEKIIEDTLEQEFKVSDSGKYELIIQSSDDEESYVAGAIGPLPDADKKFIISSISTFCIIVGMIGLGIIATYEIRNKRKSV